MFCGRCGTRLPEGAQFCPTCGTARVGTKAPQHLRPAWIAGGAIALLLVIFAGARFVGNNSISPTSTPMPKSIAEQNLVSSFYDDVSHGEYQRAYSRLSPNAKKNMSYDDLVQSYATTKSQSISGVTVSGNTVAFNLYREDSAKAGILYKTFSGSWDVTSNSNGDLALANPHSALLYSTYFQPGHPGSGSTTSTYNKIKQSLAFVLSGNDEGIAAGTSFCIGSDNQYSYFLTNSHVVPEEATKSFVVPIDQPSPSPIPAIVMYRDKDKDLAILQAPIPSIPVVVLAQQGPQEGQNIGIAGYPEVQIQLAADDLGLTPSLHLGTVNAIVADGTYIEFDATTDHGNSGGPLFDPATGVVYGIVTYGVQSDQSLAVQNNFAISMPTVMPFITSSKVRVLTKGSGGT